MFFVSILLANDVMWCRS